MLAFKNTQDIQTIMDRIPAFALTDLVESRYQSLTSQHARDFNKLESTLTPYEITKQLQNLIHETSIRVGPLEECVARKLDRSEILHLENIASQLEKDVEFRQTTLDNLSSLQSKYSTLENSLRSLYHRVDQCERGGALSQKAIQEQRKAMEQKHQLITSSLENLQEDIRANYARVEFVEEVCSPPPLSFSF
jgi:chromosome segregation ATPase